MVPRSIWVYGIVTKAVAPESFPCPSLKWEPITFVLVSGGNCKEKKQDLIRTH